jgi:hypothetical protein
MKQLIIVAALVAAAPGVARADSVTTEGKTTTHDCAKDPESQVLGSGNTITFTGPCKRISVSGKGNTLAIASTGALIVSGAGNHATVAASDLITVLGEHNVVSWAKGLSKPAPKVNDLGKDNQVTQAK